MTEVKQEHSYSEFHDFSVEGVNLCWAASDPGASLLVETKDGEMVSVDDLTDDQLASLRDLINEFLLWKKYRYTAVINEGDSFSIKPKGQCAPPVEDATGVPF